MNRFRINISFFNFNILVAALIAALNYNFFLFIYDKTSDLFISCLAWFSFFCLVAASFFILFIPFLTKFLSILFVSISCVASYFIYNYGIAIDVDMIANILATDTNEAMDFIDKELVLYVVFLGILPCLFIISADIRYGNFKASVKTRITSVVFLLGVAAITFCFKFSELKTFFRTNQSVRTLNLPFYTVYATIKYVKVSLSKGEFKQVGLDAKLKDDNKELMIFIIGESARSANFSLGGYGKNDTNFYTKNEPNLIFFPNVTSCGTGTLHSVGCMFSVNTAKTYTKNENSENTLDVLKRVGVDIAWISGNGAHGKCQGVCNRIDRTRQYYLDGYDENLLGILKNELNYVTRSDVRNAAKLGFKKKRLIVLHLHGSHYRYFERYPQEFKRFLPACEDMNFKNCDYDSLVNSYDNSLLYTDYLISEIIKLIKNQDGRVGLIYVSDHGESLGEDGIFTHGAVYSTAPRFQIHIPMIIYANRESDVEILRGKQDDNLSHDNVSSSIFGFFGIETVEYNERLDLFKN